MPSDILIDTNILVYECGRRDPEKQVTARRILGDIRCARRMTVSTQVLAEFHWTVTRKLADPVLPAEASGQLRHLVRFARVVPVTLATVMAALGAVERHQFPMWDAQIWASARLAGCPIVLSEDFSHRQTLDGVTFLNPFAPDFDLREVLA
jgi:predicted nucleic acid-binding protein